MTETSLQDLERRLAHDLECLNYPPPNWVKPRTGPGPVHDVVIYGGGMCGLVAAFALRREGIANIAVVDRCAEGLEGPWVTYARMETLRSPKHLTGPVLGLPSLTFRAWYEAQHGAAGWQSLGKIPRPMWQDYLRWYRRVLALPVENGVAVQRIAPEGDCFRLDVARDGRPGHIFARKIVMATGREGLGGPSVPAMFARLPRSLWAHTADEIEFAALSGKRVAVLGAGASAFDNAATALEAGAASVAMLVRRPDLPRFNRFKGVIYGGFLHGHLHAGDGWRWHSLYQLMADRVAPPRESVLKVTRNPRFRLALGCPIEDAAEKDGALSLRTPEGSLAFDFAILGTGFAVDPRLRPELAGFGEHIALWRDRFPVPPDEPLEELGSFPYLGPGFEFTERTPGAAPFLANLHCFNYAATLSHGPVAGDIPAVDHGAARLAAAIARGFYLEDRALHARDLAHYTDAELLGDEWPGARPTKTPG
ncbi:MAG: NAD(P)/FAD-dependent oxidoreductase [Alphaproteobacteria bacterium]